VVLKNPYNQPSTITVSDTVTPFVSATAAITVHCAGVCQSPAGTPGAGGPAQAPPTSPGGRNAGQSPGGSPGPRLSRHSAALGGLPAAITHLATASVANTTRMGVQAKPTRSTVLTRSTLPTRITLPTRATNSLAPTQDGDRLLVSQRTVASPPAAESAWNVGLVVPLGLLAIALLALRRRRNEEESNVHDRP
jgi:MYXO-CTERM domain-containing protein